jgi:hypothetical protein
MDMVNTAIYIIALVVISMLSYDSGYAAGTNDITNQITADLENILTEGQYNSIPRRTLFLFRGLNVLR